MIFTEEEGLQKSKEYFQNDLAANVFISKYALRNKEGQLLEDNPDMMHRRLAKEFARIEKKYINPLSEEEIYSYFKNFKYIVPQGSPMAGIGNNFSNVSLSNCVVAPSPEDTISSIFDTGKALANLFKRRCVEENTNVFIKDKGLIQIKDVQVGDMILSFDLENKKNVFKKVLNKFESNVEKENRITIKLKNGTILNTSLEHPVLVFSSKKEYEYNSANKLKTFKDFSLISPHQEKIDYKNFGPSDIGWFVGAHIGDGTCGKLKRGFRFRILGDEENVVKHYSQILNNLTNSNNHYKISTRKNNKTRCWEFSSGNKSNEKILSTYLDNQYGKKVYCAKIPKFIKENNLMLNFISGLIDSDGTVRKDGYSISISMCAKNVIDGVASYLSGLGIRCSVLHRQPSRKNEKLIYVLNISGNKDLWKFFSNNLRHERKKALIIKCMDNKEFSHSFVVSEKEIFDILKKSEEIYYDGSSTKNVASILSYLRTGKIKRVGFAALNEFVKFNLISENKKNEIASRADIDKICDDTTSENYIDLEVEDTNNFYAGNFGLVCVHNCGVGLDISSLRPEGMHVNNSAKSTTGPVSFADFYSYITKLIGQNNRRGALMISMDIRHPDIEQFIKSKRDLTKISYANISIKFCKEFFDAVEKDENWELRWPVEGEPKITKNIKARYLFDIVAESAAKTGDPGALFWDEITNNLPAHSYEMFKTVSTNPCVSGDTIIETNGGEKTIKELADKSAFFITDSFNEEKNIIEKKQAKAFKTHESAKLLKIKTKNGEEIKLTYDHLVLTDKGWIMAKYLTKEHKILCRIKEEKSFVKIEEIIFLEEEEAVYDLSVQDNHNFFGNNICVHNCAEIPLSNFDACRLMATNLSSFIENSFKEPKINRSKMQEVFRIAMRLSDDLVDLEIEKLENLILIVDTEEEKNIWRKIKESAENGRRTGLGTLGLAHMLHQMNLKYEYCDIIETIYEELRNISYDESINLAKERGAFPAFSYETEKDNEFIKRLPDELKEKMKIYGRRNISILTNAPTGSVAILCKTSSGMEPYYSLSYQRKRKLEKDSKESVDYVDPTNDSWHIYDVHESIVEDYFRINNTKEIPSFLSNSVANKISWKEKIKIQSKMQKYIDHAISATYNLPKGTDKEVIKEIYIEANEKGLKGITVYVDGSRDGQSVLSENLSATVAPKNERKFPQTDAPRREKGLTADVHHVTLSGEKWTIFVGLFDDKPFEVFAGPSKYVEIPKRLKKGIILKHPGKNGSTYELQIDDNGELLIVKDLITVFDNPNHTATMRLISLALRHGTPIKYLVEQLQKDKKNDLFSFSRGIARILKTYIKDGELSSSSCSCGTKYIFQDGCNFCPNCGNTKCG